jgi:hypothetical protein
VSVQIGCSVNEGLYIFQSRQALALMVVEGALFASGTIDYRYILTLYNYICVISFDPLGADYTRYFMCDFMCDLLHIADAIWGICDLVSDKNPSLSFFAPNRRRDLVCDSVSVLQLRRNRACTKLHEPNRTPNRTPNCMLRVIGSNSVSDNKSQMQHIAHEIAHEFLLV